MAWTTPTVRATGDLVTASIWNTDLVNNLLQIWNSERPKTLGGKVVGGSGAITYGTGFSASRTAAGQYSITFTTAFSAAPAVQIQPLYPGSTLIAMLNGIPTTTGFAFLILTSGAVPTDCDFEFAAWERNQ